MYFDLVTGDLLPGVVLGLQPSVVPPEGCGVVEGAHDHCACAVDPATCAIVPRRPADTELVSWSWDAPSGRWVSTPTAAAVSASVRRDRDARLKACDWVTLRALEVGGPVPAAWAEYRQALRDVTEQPGFPHHISWPDPPASA